MKTVSTERMRKKAQRNALFMERKIPFFRILCFYAFFCSFSVVSNHELWLINSSTPAGPLSQDMLSLGGFFIFKGAA